MDARRIASSNASRRDAFGKESDGPKLPGLGHILDLFACRKDQHGNIAIATPQFLHGLQAVLVAHSHIEKKHVRLAGQRVLHRFLAGFRLTDGLNLGSMYKLDDASTNCKVIIGNH